MSLKMRRSVLCIVFVLCALVLGVTYATLRVDAVASATVVLGTDKTNTYGGPLDSSNSSGIGYKYDSSSYSLTLTDYTAVHGGATDSTLDKYQRVMLYVSPNAGVTLTLTVRGTTTFNESEDMYHYRDGNWFTQGIYAPGNDIVINNYSDDATLIIYANKDGINCRNLTVNGNVRVYTCWGTPIKCENLTVNGTLLVNTTQGNGVYSKLLPHMSTGEVPICAINATKKITVNKGGTLTAVVSNDAEADMGSSYTESPMVITVKTSYLEINGGSVTSSIDWYKEQKTDKTYSYAVSAEDIKLRDGASLHAYIEDRNDALKNTAIMYPIAYEVDLPAYYSYTDDGTLISGPAKAKVCLTGDCTLKTQVVSVNTSKKHTNDSSQMNVITGNFGISCRYTENGGTKIWNATLSEYMYLREYNGVKQWSLTRDFSSEVYTLLTDTLDLINYPSTDGKQRDICVISGNFKVKPYAGDTSEHAYKAIGGSLTVLLSDGKRYDGKMDLLVYSGANIYIEGDGIIKDIWGDGCNSSGETVSCGGDHIFGGSVTFKSGTVLSGSMTYNVTGYVKGGNIDLSSANIYRNNQKLNKYTYDLGSFTDPFDPKTDISIASSSYDFTGFYLQDNKFYLWDDGEPSVYYDMDLEMFVKKYYFNHLTMHPTGSYSYRLYAELTDGDVWKLYRPEEYWSFVPASNTNYFTQSGGSLTLNAGSFVKKVDYPSPDYKTIVIDGTQTTLLPSGLTAEWSYTDKNGKKTVLKGSEVRYSVGEAVSDDDFRDYTYTVYRDGKAIGSYTCRIYVLSSSTYQFNKQGKIGDIVTFDFELDTSDRASRDNWATVYSFIWQIDKTGNGNYEDIEGTVNQTQFKHTVTAESYNYSFRVRCYCPVPTIGITYPDMYFPSVRITERPVSGFGEFSSTPALENGTLTVYAGDEISMYMQPRNIICEYVDIWLELSVDGGNTYKKIVYDGNTSITRGVFATMILGANGSETYDQTIIFYGITMPGFTSDMDGAILRWVIKDVDVYSYWTIPVNVIDIPNYISQPKSVTVPTENKETVTMSAEHASSDAVKLISYQWQYATSNRPSEWKDIGGANSAVLNGAQMIGDAKSYYRCVVTLERTDGEGNTVTHKHYSERATLCLITAPTFDDSGMNDHFGEEGDKLTLKVTIESEGSAPSTVGWEVSRDGGLTWEEAVGTVGSNENERSFTVESLSLLSGGLYRCRITVSSNGAEYSIYSKTVKLATADAPTINRDASLLDCGFGGKAYIAVSPQMPVGCLNVTYKWYGKRISDGSWTALEGDDFSGTDAQMLTVHYSVGLDGTYSAYRCDVTYSLGDDVKTLSSDEASITAIGAPVFISAPRDTEVWYGETVSFKVEYNTVKKAVYTALWEFSDDGGKTWRDACDLIDGVKVGYTEYSVYADDAVNGLVYRCTVTVTLGEISFSSTTDGVTVTVKKITGEESLRSAIEYGLADIKLFGDISLNATLAINFDLTLDLNGYILRYVGDDKESVITVNGGAALTIVDSAPKLPHGDMSLPSGGLITGGSGTETDAVALGGGIYVYRGKLYLNGGTV